MWPHRPVVGPAQLPVEWMLGVGPGFRTSPQKAQSNLVSNLRVPLNENEFGWSNRIVNLLMLPKKIIEGIVLGYVGNQRKMCLVSGFRKRHCFSELRKMPGGIPHAMQRRSFTSNFPFDNSSAHVSNKSASLFLYAFSQSPDLPSANMDGNVLFRLPCLKRFLQPGLS